MSSPIISSWENARVSTPLVRRPSVKPCADGEGAKEIPDLRIAIHGDAMLFKINRRLDRVGVPHELNEHLMEELFVLAAGIAQQQGMVYWLVLARLLEAALLCAGHYADNCEFGAAGDLLVNPRKIRVCVGNTRETFDKVRHGRLTDQLAGRRSGRKTTSVDRREVACDIVVPALLPYLYRSLVVCGYFDRSYLSLVERRMTAVADTIGFLAAGQIDSNELLHQRMQAAGPAEREFLQRHLCRFEDTWFRRFGSRIRRIQSGEMAKADDAGR